MREAAASPPHFHAKNRGRGAAVKTGFAASTGKVAGFLDIDLEIGAGCLPTLIDGVLKGDCDVVSGRRRYAARDLRQPRGLVRYGASLAYRLLQGALLGAGVRDTETGCKFFERARAGKVVAESVSDDWFWDTEVMVRAVLAGLTLRELPVRFRRRAEKRSTVHVWPDSLRQVRALLGLRRALGMALSSKSPVYWTSAGYDGAMRLLYRAQYRQTYEAVARRIPDDAEVVDVCCGTARLYRAFLRGRGVRYLGLDFNGRFVLGARRSGANTRCFDLLSEPVPAADYAVMCSSLYHFRGCEAHVVEKLQRAARRAVILSEPVSNAAASRYPYVRRAARRLSAAGVGEASARYDLASLRSLAERYDALEFEHRPGHRNAVVVLPGAHLPCAQPPRPVQP